MHEMSIAVELIAQVQSVAAANNLVTIETVAVAAGVLRAIVPDALNVAFECVAEGTCAEGAALSLEIVQPRGRCRECGTEFGLEIDTFLCPHCNRADVELTAGNDIILTSVTGSVTS